MLGNDDVLRSCRDCLVWLLTGGESKQGVSGRRVERACADWTRVDDAIRARMESLWQWESEQNNVIRVAASQRENIRA